MKEVTGSWSARIDVINDREGNSLTEDEEIKKRWAEYCQTLYNKIKQDPLSKRTATNTREPPPLREEVVCALKKLQNGKSPGIDDIPIELRKATGNTGIDLLWMICKKIWNDMEWPKIGAELFSFHYQRKKI